MTRSQERLAAALLAAAGALFALLLLELGVRWLHLLPDRFWEPDPVLGARLIAGRSGWWTQEDREFVVPIRINGQGLRDIERGYEKPEGAFRILVLGDSFVEALHVELEETFTRRLQAAFEAEGRRVEVIGAGVSGYGTAGELLYFEREGHRYDPDLVVLSFYPGNDVRNNSAVLEDTLRPVYDGDGTLLRVEGSGPVDGAGRDGRLVESAAYRYLRKLVLTRQPKVARWLADAGIIRPEAVRVAPEQGGIPVAYGVYAEPLSAEWEEAWRRTEGLLDRLRAAVRDAGATLMISVVTTREEIYPETWDEILTANPAMRDREWDLRSPQRRLQRWCEAAAIPCLQLDREFSRVRGVGSEPLHYHHDGHWTPAGHAVAAAALKSFIEERQLPPMKAEGEVQ